jgi:hypothetical protein
VGDGAGAIGRLRHTYDIYEELVSRRPHPCPVVRVFGMAGDASREARAYAARHGIVLIERSRWPVPVSGDPLMDWEVESPSISEQRALAFLGRPMNRVYRRTNESRLVSPRYLDPTVVDELLAVHEGVPTRFDRLIRAEAA